MVFQNHYWGFQYHRILKTERYDDKRVVPTLSLNFLYQRDFLEVVLKYGGGDISRSSLVFCCSKDNKSSDGPLLRQSTTQLFIWIKDHLIINNRRKSVRQVWMKGDYLVMSRSLHTEVPSQRVVIRKTFSPARTNWGGILGKSQVRWE